MLTFLFPIDTTRRLLGELGAMAAQTEAMERKLLERAEGMLAGIEAKINAARSAAMAGDDAAKQRYIDMVEERGRLQLVIAQARQVLAL